MAAGAYTSVPDVLDYLVSTVRALPACAAPVVVSDGWIGTNQPQKFVSVAGDDETSSALRDYAVMSNGPLNLEEHYGVPLWIRCWRGGTDAKGPRDDAFLIFKAIEAAVRADPNLGGAISRHYPATVSDLDVQQPAGPKGRAAELKFLINVKHRY